MIEEWPEWQAWKEAVIAREYARRAFLACTEIPNTATGEDNSRRAELRRLWNVAHNVLNNAYYPLLTRVEKEVP